MRTKDIVLIALLINVNACAQTLEKERLELTQEFIQEIKNGILSNEQIVEKYVVEGNYLKTDSTKQAVDQWMNDHRTVFNMDTIHFKFIKYSDHEEEFFVSDHPVGERETVQKLIFKLSRFDGSRSTDVNIGDLYAVILETKYDKGTIFILFDNDNRMISFIGITMGYYTTLMQF